MSKLRELYEVSFRLNLFRCFFILKMNLAVFFIFGGQQWGILKIILVNILCIFLSFSISDLAQYCLHRDLLDNYLGMRPVLDWNQSIMVYVNMFLFQISELVSIFFYSFHWKCSLLCQRKEAMRLLSNCGIEMVQFYSYINNRP